MASRKVLSIGDRLNLTKKSRDETVTKNYLSQIQDFEDSDKVVISMPLEKNNYVPLKIGEVFETCFYTKGGLYKCKVEVIDYFKDGKQYVLVIQFKSELEKFQRREYFRLEYVTDIRFSKITNEKDVSDKEKEVILENNWQRAILTDISGGGMRYNSSTNYEGETELYVKFSLGNPGNKFECMCKAKVIAFKELENMPGVYEYRVSFTDITKLDRENVVKFIFEEERRRRKKIDRF